MLTNEKVAVDRDPVLRSAAHRYGFLYVSGKKIAEGRLTDMTKRFEQEIAGHSASVEVKEDVDGQELSVRVRRRRA